MQESKNFTQLFSFDIIAFKGNIQDLSLKFWINEVYQFSKSNPNSVSRSNKGGYQSSDNIHQFPSFYPLVKIINDYNYKLTGNPNSKISTMWLNISGYGHYNTPHTHSTFQTALPNQLSGVLYLKTPSNCGNIEFLNPNDINDFRSYNPQEKDILIFPQFLPHLVEPNFSQEDRISIAFNYE